MVKGGTVEILALSYIVDKVNNHPCTLHEQKSKNSVNGYMWNCCDDKRCIVASLCLVWEVELPAGFHLVVTAACSLNCTIPERTIGA